MKNGKLVTDYLDECAERHTMAHSQDLAVLEALFERVQIDRAGDLHQACLDDGWTMTELDAAFERRFNCKVKR